MKPQRTTRFLCAMATISVLFAPLACSQFLVKTPEMRQIWQPSVEYGIRVLDFSPDGKTVAMPQDSGDSIELRLFGTDEKRVLKAVPALQNRVDQAVFSPDGVLLAGFSRSYGADDDDAMSNDIETVANNAIKAGQDSASAAVNAISTAISIRAKAQIVVWNVATGRQIAAWSEKSPDNTNYSLSWTSSGLVVRTLGNRNKVFAQLRTFDAAALARGHFEAQSHVDLEGASPETSALALSPDGLLAAMWASGNVTIVDATTGKVRHEWKAPPQSTEKAVFYGTPALRFSPDARRLLVGARIWDVESGQWCELQGDFSYGSGLLSWSPDGTLLFGAGARLWDAQSGQLLGGVKTMESYISDTKNPSAFEPDGKTAISVGDGLIRWDVDRMRALNRVLDLPRPGAPELQTSTLNAWSFGNNYGFDIVRQAEVVTLQPRHSELAWMVRDAGSRRIVGSMPRAVYYGEPERATMAIAPGGRVVAVANADARTGNTQILLYDVANQRALSPLRVVKDAVYGLQFSPDGRSLATSSEDKRVRVFDVKSGLVKQVWRIHVNSRIAHTASMPGASMPGESEQYESHEVWGALTWSPDSKHLAVAGAAGTPVQILEVASGKVTRQLRSANTTEVQSLAWSRDGRTVAVGGSPVRLWDLRSGRLARALHAYEHAGVEVSDSSTRYVGFARDSQSLLTGERTSSSIRWNLNWLQQPLRDESLKTFALPSKLPSYAQGESFGWGSADVGFSPDGRLLGAAGRDLYAVWRLADAKLLRRWPIREWPWFSPDSRSLIAASDGEETRFDLATGRVSNRVLKTFRDVTLKASEEEDSPLAQPIRLRLTDAIIDFAGHRRGIVRWLQDPPWNETGAISPDGKTAVASAGSSVWLWDTTTGMRRLMDVAGDATFIATQISPDGKLVAAANIIGFISVWDAQSGQLLHTLSGHTATPLTLAWSRDSRRLASGGEDNTVRVWDIRSGQLQHTFDGHQDAVLSVDWSPNGRQIASRSQDGTVKLWGTP